MEPNLKRSIILDNYQNPKNKGLIEDDSYVKINMNSLHIVKCTKEVPKYFIIHTRKKLKEIFNQKSIVAKSTEGINLEIV